MNTHWLTRLRHWQKCDTRMHACIHTYRSQSLTVDRASSSFPMFSPFSLIPVSLCRLPFSHLIFSNSYWLLSALLPAKRCPLPSLRPPDVPRSCLLSATLPPFLSIIHPPYFCSSYHFHRIYQRLWNKRLRGKNFRILSPPPLPYPSHRHAHALFIYISGI